MDEDLFSDSPNESARSDSESVIDDSDIDQDYDPGKEADQSSSSGDSADEEFPQKRRRQEQGWYEEAFEEESHESEDEERETTEDLGEKIKYMSSSLSALSRKDLIAKGRLSEERKQILEKGLRVIKGPLTLEEIDSNFEKKKKKLNEEMEDVERKHQQCKNLAIELWEAIEKEQKIMLKRQIKPRIRKTSAKFRKQKLCPVAGCPGRAANMRRHLSQVHKYIKKSERDRIISIHKKLEEKMESKHNESKLPMKPKKYLKRRCNVCDKEVKRIDVHLRKTHNLKRGPQFSFHLKESLPVEDVQGVESVEIDAGSVCISSEDGIKTFLDNFKRYLESCKILKESSRNSYARNVGQMLTASLGDKPLSKLSARTVCKTLQTIGDPDGFFAKNENRLSPGTRAKYAKGALLAIEYLRSSNQISEPTEREVSLQLQTVIVKQRKEEAKRAPTVRRRKELENIELHVIHELRESNYVRRTMNIAIDSLEDEDYIPTTLAEFTRLRDVLIMVLIISSLKRVMEFVEFRLCEFLEREVRKTKTGETCFVIRIARHKTAESGPSLLFVDEDEEKALLAYMKYYRPLAVPCSEPLCYMFPTRSPVSGGCCCKMQFPNVNRILQTVSRKAASDAKITSRILRRSQITALWEKSDDPSWRQNVANLAGHSLATAARYYEYSDKVPPGLVVFESLKEMRRQGWTRPAQQVHRSIEESEAEEEEPQAMEESALATKEADLLHNLETDEVRPSTSQVQRSSVVVFKVPALPPRNIPDDLSVVSAFSSESEAEVQPERSSSHRSVDGSSVSSKRKVPSSRRSSTEASGERSLISGSLLSALPESMSLVSSFPQTSSTPKQDTRIPDLQDKVPTAMFHRDLAKSVKHCDVHNAKGFHFIRWKSVREHLISINRDYADYSEEQIRNKYKYFKSLSRAKKR